VRAGRAKKRNGRRVPAKGFHMSITKRYGFLWITGALFAFSLAGHWVCGWFAYVREAHAHHEPVSVGDYAVEMGRDTLENWQSEFLQLVWQVGGLTFLLSVGSSQSKEGDERLEAKVDWLMSATQEGRAEMERLDARYLRA
jgi:hypothetical protein